MYLSELNVVGFKGFGEPFSISFTEGINILVGENSSGKSAVVDAVRMLMNEDEFGRAFITDRDFYRPFSKPQNRSSSLNIQCVFDGLTKEEGTVFMPWSIEGGRARLNFLAENKQTNKGYFKRKVWGGESHSSAFEWELFDRLTCIYLPPLRDAEFKLKEGRYSRLARLLRKLNNRTGGARKDKELHPLEEDVKAFNETLTSDKDKAIYKANHVIKERLKEAMGTVFGQETIIQFSEVNFDRIVENLRLLFFPDISTHASPEMFRSLEENSLGYNNLLYLATVLAELTTDEDKEFLKLLLIEEPEAHLHPQLQTKLLQYLEKTSREKSVQVVVTTHSPVFSAAMSIDSIIHLKRENETKSVSTSISECGLSDSGRSFINRWMDVTKSTLLFSRGVILVEGIAEGMLVPEFASSVIDEYNRKMKKEGKGPELLGKSLEELGVSVINMNGIYFKNFMQLFCNIGECEGVNLPLRCSGITDNDPVKQVGDEANKVPSAPTYDAPMEGKNHALKLVDDVNKSEWCRLYPNCLKTFEYDLAFEGENAKYMAEILISLWPTDGDVKKELKKIVKIDFKTLKDQEKRARVANIILNRIDSQNVGKGHFAQVLADRIRSDEKCQMSVPNYIRKAVIWACGGDPDES